MKDEVATIHFSAGSTVLVENSVNEGYFYILKSGEIKIQSRIVLKEKEYNKYKPGDTFALVSGLTKNRIRNTLSAVTDCEVARIPLNNLGEYLDKNREICLKIISLYSNHLRALDSYIVRSNRSIDQLENPEKLLQDSQCYIDSGRMNEAAHSLSSYIKWAVAAEKNPKGVELAEARLKEIAPDFKFPSFNSNKITLSPGEVIFVENKPADYFYVIEDGAVKISKLVNGQEVILSILREGEIFGEMAVLNKRVRNATASVFENAKLIRLSVDSFLDDVGSKIISTLFENFSRRIWYAHQRALLFDMTDLNSKLYCYLQILISDLNAKNKIKFDNSESSGDIVQGEYIFNFSLSDLLKMIGHPDAKNDLINDFLTDGNIDISNHCIRIIDRRKIDDKAAIYKTREKNKED